MDGSRRNSSRQHGAGGLQMMNFASLIVWKCHNLILKVGASCSHDVLPVADGARCDSCAPPFFQFRQKRNDGGDEDGVQNERGNKQVYHKRVGIVVACVLMSMPVLGADLTTDTEVNDAAQTILVAKPKGQLEIITVRAFSSTGKRGHAAIFESANPKFKLNQHAPSYWCPTNQPSYFRVSHDGGTNLYLFPLPK